MFGSQADRLSQLHEVFRFQFGAFDECAYVSRAEMRLLQSQLSCACERRRHITIKRNVAQRENVWMAADLQGWFDDNQAATISFDCKRISQWVGAHTGNPHHTGGLYFEAIIFVFERDVILSHAYRSSCPEPQAGRS